MPRAYSRDELAEPLRRLDAVLDYIRAGVFAPDKTRSGYFEARRAKTDGAADDVFDSDGAADNGARAADPSMSASDTSEDESSAAEPPSQASVPAPTVRMR